MYVCIYMCVCVCLHTHKCRVLTNPPLNQEPSRQKPTLRPKGGLESLAARDVNNFALARHFSADGSSRRQVSKQRLGLLGFMGLRAYQVSIYVYIYNTI